MIGYSLAHTELETPLLNAAGSINGTNPEKILREVEILARTAIGAITVGSFTVNEQAGNAERYGNPVYYYDQKSGRTYNSMGLPNIGLKAAVELMPEIIKRAHEYGKPVIASVSPSVENDANGKTINQVARLVYEMSLTGADLIELNTSCPNIVTGDGNRKPILGRDPEAMAEVIAEVAFRNGTINSITGLKLPPYENQEDQLIVPELARNITDSGAFSFIVTANTIPNHKPMNDQNKPILTVPQGLGGLSGPATAPIGRDQLTLWKDAVGNKIDIVSALGIYNGLELARRLELGATAGSGVTFLWESANWGHAVTTMIDEWIEVSI